MSVILPLDIVTREAQRSAIEQAMERFGNKVDAARALGVGRKQLYTLMHRLGLAPKFINPKGWRGK